MANIHRGEVDVVLCGKTFVCRPTFEAMAEYENACGVSTYEILERMSKGKPPMASQAVAILHATINAAWKPADGRPPTKAAIGNLLQREGMAKVYVKLTELLTRAVCSDEELELIQKDASQGKAEAAAEGQT